MSDHASFHTLLSEDLRKLDLALDDNQVTRLLDFLDLLQKWNRVYNLTAVRTAQDMLTHHLLDSLAAVEPLRRHIETLNSSNCQAEQGIRLLDVGSGGGLPGAVFAICCPSVDVHCVDAVGKKVAFIRQVAAALHLSNLHGIHARAETLATASTASFDVVSYRAFASLTDFTALTRQVLAPQAVWFAMKGRLPQEEMDALPADVVVFHVEQLHVPRLNAQRCIVWMCPAP